MKLPVVLAVLVGILVLACSTVAPTTAKPIPDITTTEVVEPTPDINATVEARLVHERAVDATVEARLKEEKAGITLSPFAMGVGAINKTPTVLPEQSDTKVSDAATSIPTLTPRPTLTPTPRPTSTPNPTPTYTPQPTPTPRPTPTHTPQPTPTPRPTSTPIPTPNAYSYYEKGDDYRRSENWVMAIGEYTRAIGLDSQFRNAYFYRAYSYSELGQDQNAIEDYTTAIQITPGGPAYNNRSISYKALGLYANANADIAQACSFDSKYCPPPTPTPRPTLTPTPRPTITPTPTLTPTLDTIWVSKYVDASGWSIDYISSDPTVVYDSFFSAENSLNYNSWYRTSDGLLISVQRFSDYYWPSYDSNYDIRGWADRKVDLDKGNQFNTEYNLISFGAVLHDGSLAYESVHFQTQVVTGPQVIIKLFVLNGSDAFVIEGSVDQEDWSQMEPLLRALVYSFELPAPVTSGFLYGSDCSPAINSYIDGTFEGWEGDTVFTLMNGQIWQQTEYDYMYDYDYMPDVTIYSSSGSCILEVEGVDDTIRVTRIN